MRNLKRSNVCLGGGAEPKNSLFKPLVATSLALALGVSVANAGTIGGDNPEGDNGSTAGEKYFVVDSTGSSPLPSNQLGTLGRGSGSGGTLIDLTWSNASNLGVTYTTQTTTVSAKNVVVQYITDTSSNGLPTNTLYLTGQMYSGSKISFLNSTFIGNIASQQSNGGTGKHHTFDGNGTYTGGSGSTRFAMVGDLIGVDVGSNAYFDLTNGANMQGRIYAAIAKGNINVNFSNATNPTAGNTFYGIIGGKALNADSEGTISVVFENSATVKANSTDNNGTIIFAGAQTKNTIVNVTFKGDASESIMTGDIISGTELLMTNGTNRETVTINSSAGNLTIGAKGNQILARKSAVNTINITGGSTTINSDLIAGYAGYTAYANVGRNIIKFSNDAIGNIYGNITSQWDDNKNYILATGTGTINVGDETHKITITSKTTGGSSGSDIFITDYDSTASGFTENASGSQGNISLNASSLTIANHQNNIGQKFIFDSYSGNVKVASTSIGDNQFIVMRLRNQSNDTSITIGDNENFNGNLNSGGSNGKLFLQAKTIEIYGNVNTSNAGQTYLRGVGTSSDTIAIHGSIITSGNNANTLTSISSAGDNLTLKAAAIYGLSDNNGYGQGKFEFGTTATAVSGGLDISLLAAAKSNGGGGGNFQQSIVLDNNSNSNNVLISVIDFSSETLALRGGNRSDGTLSNTKGTITLGGNVAIYNNTQNSVNTVDVKVGATSKANIIGDIVTQRGGANNNIRLIGATGSTPFLIGNVITTAGNTNIILENAIFAPKNLTDTPIASYALTSQQQAELINTYAEQYGTGKISTSGGRSTIISRLSSDLTNGKNSIFEVDSTGGETNIVTLSKADSLHIQSYVNYSGGAVNMIFTNSNDGLDTKYVGGVTGGTAIESLTGTTNATTNTFFGLTYKDGVKLTLQDKNTQIGNQQNASLLQTYGYLYRADNGSYVHIDSLRNKTSNIDTVLVSGFAVGTISQLNASSTINTYNVTLQDKSVFAGSILLDASKSKINLVMGSASKLILIDPKTTLQTLTLSGNNTINQQEFALDSLAQTSNTVINLATGGASSSNVYHRENFRALVIGDNTSLSANTGLQGEGSVVFVNYINANANQTVASIGGTTINGKGTTAYADRIVVENVGDNSKALSGKYYMQFAVDYDTNLSSIKYTEGTGGTADTDNANIAVATIAKLTNAGSGTSQEEIKQKGVITIESANTLQGFDVLSGSLKAVETKQDGTISSTPDENKYVTYFIDSVKTSGVDSSIQDVTASAFATSLDIFMANFNSLNKRMGELRDNNNSQGAWARVFGGSQSSSFGLGSKTSYVTTQAGYDYAFGFEGANNYLGVAVAYGYSSSSTSNATNTLNGVSEGIEGDLKSNMVEVALYNSYVADSGWYNDSIFKFDYIMNSFNASGTAMGNTVDTNTFGIILSDEFGYRFKLGSENEWYIDPQAEFSFGYVNGTQYTLTSGDSTLQAKSDSMMQLRSRFGSSFGYDFKKFTANKPIKASVYVGAFYEYDYLSGGDVTLTTNLGGVNSIQSSLSSDGRVVMNVGTNMTIKDNTRIYFDFESSFAGKINTDYQVNVGVRYSFGENTGYTPMTAKKEVAPLKVSDGKTEESKEVENTENKTEENKAQ